MNLEQAVWFARRMREARARVQADAEAYLAVAVEVERLGKALGAKDGGMGQAGRKIAAKLFPNGVAPSLFASFERVQLGRNIAAHEGAEARAVGGHALALAIALEGALMKAANACKVRDWMVPNPLVAHPWMTVADVRSELLKAGFSAIPLWCGGEWRFVRDCDVAAYLWKGGADADALCADGKPVFKLIPAPLVFAPEDDASGAADADWTAGLPALVADRKHPERLLGVLAPHDLLVR